MTIMAWADWHSFDEFTIAFYTRSGEGGVYCIADGRKDPVYVGSTKSLSRRLLDHCRGVSDQSSCILNSGAKFFRSIVIEDPEERKTFEAMLLELGDTPCNG